MVRTGSNPLSALREGRGSRARARQARGCARPKAKEVQGSQAMQLRVPAGSAPGNRLLQESLKGALQEEGSALTLKLAKQVEHDHTCHAPSESNVSIRAHWRCASGMRRHLDRSRERPNLKMPASDPASLEGARR